jgi:hypothetical protein
MVIVSHGAFAAYAIFLIVIILWNAVRSSYPSSYAPPTKAELGWKALKARQNARQREAVRSFFRRIFYRAAA